MEKTIQINGKAVPFKCTGGFLIRFKQLTGKDPLQSVMGLENRFRTKARVQFKDMQLLYEIAWVLAKTADSSVPDLASWLDGFDEFPLQEVFLEIQELLVASFAGTVRPKNESKKK